MRKVALLLKNQIRIKTKIKYHESDNLDVRYSAGDRDSHIQRFRHVQPVVGTEG